ncbi:MAG: precorrin-3B synthase [Hyphomicrobium sp.]|nr:precorrin-3B synthase [Hyphomicrobium sp.]
MSLQQTLRRGWCPGALTPMQTGDGWLIRVRPRAGRYSMAQLEAIAAAAQDCGNGQIDLTNRSNLQIRGLSDASMLQAQTIIADAGLIDDDPAHEALRNIIVSPLSGLDPDARDVRQLAADLEVALARTTTLTALPGKFGFAIDGGGAGRLPSGVADIVLRVSKDGTSIGLAGAPSVAAVVEPDKAIAAMLRLAHVFLDLVTARTNLRRMRDAIATFDAARFFKLAGLQAIPSVAPSCKPSKLLIGPIGPQDNAFALGIGLPFGRITAPDLCSIVDSAVACGVTETRLALGRSLVFPIVQNSVARLSAAAVKCGMIVDSTDPRLTMDVCPGAPACDRGTTDTRADATRIADALRAWEGDRPSIHISGCAKGCASNSAAAFTFVARDGVYDLMLDGRVNDTPTKTGLSSDALAAELYAIAGASNG